MKRVIQVLVLFLVGAFAFAQGFPPPVQTGTPEDISPVWNGSGASMAITEIDAQSASGAKSIEKKYSAGVFSSGIDNFVGVNGYKSLNLQNIFVYAAGADPDGAGLNREVMLGFAKKFDKFYAAAFFAGSLPSGEGQNTVDGDDKKTSMYLGEKYDDNMAFLFAMDSIGAIRLDLLMNPNNSGDLDYSERYDGKINNKGEQNTPFLAALSWGGKTFGKLTPNAALAFESPMSRLAPNAGDPEKLDKNTNDGRLILKGGVDIGSLGFGLAFDIGFGNTTVWHAGDKEITYTKSGDFKTELSASYSLKVDAGKAQIGLTPKMNLNLMFADNKYTISEGAGQDSKAVVTKVAFELKPAVDAGVSFALTKKMTLFTGLTLTVFDWYSESLYADKDTGTKEDTYWKFSGLKLDTTDPSNTLQLGLTIKPSSNLSIGMGANTILDKFFKVNVKELSVSTGSFFGNHDVEAGGGDASTEAFYIFQPVSWLNATKLYLTVSYQM